MSSVTTKRSASAGSGPEPHLPADRTSRGPLPAGEGAPAKGASAVLVAGFGILVACLFLFGTVAEGIRDHEVFVLDTVATPFLHGLASPTLDAAMLDATTMGSTAVLPALFVVATILLLALRRFGAALFLGVSSGGALVINELMKLFFHRPRPQLPWAHVQPDYSFPSGHTMNSVAFYLAVAIIVWSIAGRRWGTIAAIGAIVLCTTIGISRIYLGFHYFTDVVGGALAGTAWVLVVLAAFRSRRLAGLWDPVRARRSGRSRGSP
jgi:undecaprenyl-diphosphatase